MRGLFLGIASALVVTMALVAIDASAQPLTVQQQALKKNTPSEAEDAGNGTLEDALRPTVRRLVQEELTTASSATDETQPQSTGSSDPFADLIEGTRTGVETLSKNFQRSVDALPELPEQFRDRAFLLLTDFNGWPRMWEGIFNLLAMLIAGGVAAAAVGRLLGRILSVPESAPEYGFARLTVSTIMLVKGLVLVAIFAGVGFLASLVWFAQFNPMRIFLITYLGAAATGYLGWIIAGFLFAPTRPGHRMADIQDAAARRLSTWLTILFSMVGLAGFSVGMVRLLGMAPVTFDIMLQLSGLVVFVATAVLIVTTAGPPDGDEE